MEYKNFEEFYNRAYDLAQQAKHKKKGSRSAILFARKIFSRQELNNFYSIGYLKTNQKLLLQAQTSSVKFSLDSFIKNIIKHPEISYEEYLKITAVLKYPDKISLSKSSNNSILLFKWDSKYYQVVIKTTLDKKENFLTSFRMLNEKEFNKY